MSCSVPAKFRTKGVDNVCAEGVGSTEGDIDGVAEGEAGDIAQMWCVAVVKLISKDCSGKPVLVCWVECSVISPKEDEVVIGKMVWGNMAVILSSNMNVMYAKHIVVTIRVQILG